MFAGHFAGEMEQGEQPLEGDVSLRPDIMEAFESVPPDVMQADESFRPDIMEADQSVPLVNMEADQSVHPGDSPLKRRLKTAFRNNVFEA